jgi:uncharacterized protein (TIGR01777 family)
MATILITGGTGLVGKALSSTLMEKGYDVIILTRKKKEAALQNNSGKLRFAEWNIQSQVIEKEAISQADYIIHLAGAGVADKRWTKKRKKEILDSRVNSSKLIVDSLNSIPNKVKAVISASAIGWYGPDPAIPNLNPFSEDKPSADDFLGKTCQLWENSIAQAAQEGKRIVLLRTGIVLSTKGGALKEFLKPLQFGIAAILGNGKQIISWIHMDDLVRMYIAAIENENLKGIYNAVAPHPVSNRQLTKELANQKKKIFITVYVPSFVLQLVLGEMSTEVLKSTTVSAEKILSAGFEFKFPEIKEALADLC